MAIAVNKQETAEIIPSLQKYCREELDQELSEMRARLLLDYILKEIGPYAYNQGVRDAEVYFRSKVEDLSATCFATGLTYWIQKPR